MSGKIMMDNTIHRRWGKEDEALGKEKRSPWKGKERGGGRRSIVDMLA